MKDFKDTEGKNHKKIREFSWVLWGPNRVGGRDFREKLGENFLKIAENKWYFQNFRKPKISSRKIFPKFRNKDQTDFSKNALQMVN